jgi:hypothetical protein
MYENALDSGKLLTRRQAIVATPWAQAQWQRRSQTAVLCALEISMSTVELETGEFIPSISSYQAQLGGFPTKHKFELLHSPHTRFTSKLSRRAGAYNLNTDWSFTIREPCLPLK